MKRCFLITGFFLLCSLSLLQAQDSLSSGNAAVVSIPDSLPQEQGPEYAKRDISQQLLDTLGNDSLTLENMAPYKILLQDTPADPMLEQPFTVQIKSRDIRSFEAWRFYSLLVIFLLLSVFRMMDGVQFLDMAETVWPGRDNRRFEMFRRQSLWINLKGTFLLASVLGYFLFEIFNHLPMLAFRQNIEIYLIVVAIAWGLLLLKMGMDRVVGGLMGLGPMMKDYVLHVGINAYVVAFVLFPVVLLLSYGQEFLNVVQVMTIGGGLFLLSQLLRVLKLFHLAGQQKGYSFFYLIIYFCALEIAPWILLFKLINTHL